MNPPTAVTDPEKEAFPVDRVIDIAAPIALPLSA